MPSRNVKMPHVKQFLAVPYEGKNLLGIALQNQLDILNTISLPLPGQGLAGAGALL